ncbi:MAG: hypothetical protein V7717_00590 [Porticoccaceae bacterium]
MSSRMRALLVAFVGNLLPLLSPATVALVAMRKGTNEGALVLLFSVLSLVLMSYVSELNLLMVWASVASVVVVLLGALLLKATASWQSTLLMIVLLSAGSVAVMDVAMAEAMAKNVAQLRVNLLEMLGQMNAPALNEASQLELNQTGKSPVEQGQAGNSKPMALELGDQFIFGLLAWVVAISSIASLVLGRWWQSLLYNPGGFAEEFRALRIQPPLALASLAGMTGCYLFSADYVAWGNLLGLPLLVAGLALVHHLVASAKKGAHWLAIFYICLVLMLGPLSMLLLGLGLVDSVLDLRSRWARRSGDI